MSTELLMIVDDDTGVRETLSDALKDEGYDVITAASGEETLELLKETTPDAIFLDIWLPGMDGIQTLTHIKESIDVPIIMISAHGDIETAVRTIKLGAYDFLQKPPKTEELLFKTRKALELRRLISENRNLKATLIKKWKLVGSSEKMKYLNHQIEMAAHTSSRVLITGESGTGKEIIARLLHEKSPRFENPFVEVNCAAIPQELIESELFGHEKGSFTGASERKIGKFELADKGTLFLDEIGDMSLITQSKVLRVIETQTFQRVGGSKNIRVDTRIIAATNKDLLSEVKKGSFREDLYFRLNVISISSPSLRERSEDIPELVHHFVSLISSESGIKSKEISPDVIKMFEQYEWHGNIRELKNAVERIMIMVPSNAVQMSDIENMGLFQFKKEQNEYSYFTFKTLKDARDAFERDFIIRKLKENYWNISKTSEAIAVERSNLHKKIKSYGINTEWQSE
jgi:two-component system nitrogen regulation response regulator NtrX